MLSQKARAEGIRVYPIGDGLFKVESGDHDYEVSLAGCTCKGYLYKRQCKHLAAVLSWVTALG